MNNLANISTIIANIVLIIFVITALMLMVGMICYSFIISHISEKKYQKSAISILKSKCKYEIIKKQLKQIFQTYSTKNSSYLNMVQLNSRLIERLHNKKIDDCNDKEIVEYCDILTKLNDDFNDEHLFNDDKLNNLLNQTDDVLLKEKIKFMFLCINSYNDGRLFEKDKHISELNGEISKMKKVRVISFVVGAVGFVSSLITIFSVFWLKNDTFVLYNTYSFSH